jgi:hypothetical protein
MTKDCNNIYDMIIIGSGNGACGFLSHYVQKTSKDKIAVLEEGKDFFDTSDITHQRNWTRSYAEGDIFKLHKAATFDGTPILSGRACTMGGGGSINYTMIHESSEWLTANIGKTVIYWDNLKKELNEKFAREAPSKAQSNFTKNILKIAREYNFLDNTKETCNIPDYQEGEVKLLHPFPTQFDRFGQRTHSGVSLVDDWSCVDLRTECKVVEIKFEKSKEGKGRCVSVLTENTKTGEQENLHLSEHGKLILCAGAKTPWLLYKHREYLENDAIGKNVSDHIVLPLGVYTIPKEDNVSLREAYIPVFATTVCNLDQQEQPTVCCFDFFAGKFEDLWFFISHMYLAFLLPNWLKKLVIRYPCLFSIIKNVVRMFVQLVNGIVDVFQFICSIWGRKPWDEKVNMIVKTCVEMGTGKINGFHLLSSRWKNRSWRTREISLVTTILKFNPSIEGEYRNDGSDIALGFFAKDSNDKDSNDKKIAKNIIEENFDFVNHLGNQPHPIFKWIFHCFTKIPYQKDQIEAYIDIYSQKFLLSQQHLSGGCLFGKAIDTGAITQTDTGKLNGSSNIYVADLSAVPLPRISPQMTAYLIGYHVAKMLRSDH